MGIHREEGTGAEGGVEVFGYGRDVPEGEEVIWLLISVLCVLAAFYFFADVL